MSSKAWADAAVEDLKRVAVAAAAVSSASGPGQAKAARATLSPQAVAAALAEAVKSDDATTQAIAIRLANLAARYPQRAY